MPEEAETPRGAVVVIPPPSKPKREKVSGSGRKTGTPNRIPTVLKDMIIQALDEAGGVNYLLTQAFLEPKAFLALLGRVLPLQIAGDPTGSPIVIQEVRRVIVDPKKEP